MLYENAPQVFADERLSSINPEGYETLEQYVTFILLNGSPIQRASLLDNLDTLCDISMPEIKQISRAPALALIETYIRQTCQIMGCDFKGDLPTVVTMLYDDYGGLTIIEWARFFQHVAQGKYKDEYQSVNTRGLNAEFLRDWLDQFYSRRDDIIASLRKQMPEKATAEPENALTFEEIRRIQRDSIALDGDVHNWRTEYNSSLTTTRIEHVRDEHPTDDGKFVIYEYELPIIEDKEKAAYTRLYDFLAVFYAFDGQSVKEIISDLTITWELERVIDFENVEPPQFYRSRAKMFLANLRRFVSIATCRTILDAGLSKMADEYPTTGEFFQALTGKEHTGDKQYVAIRPHLNEVASKLLREFHDSYGDDARQRIGADAFVLYRDEYIAFRCIHWAVKTAGIQHPFYSILNIEQQ